MSKPALHEVSSGAGDDLVVLLHGFSDNADTWNKVAPTLAEDARLLAVDLPGFGRSAASGDTPLFDGYVRVVVDLLQRHRGPGSVSIVGNSLGAVVALLVATERPELVDRVVLADMPGLTGIPRLWRLALSPPVECALTPVLRLLPTPVARTGFLGFCYALGGCGAASAGRGDAFRLHRALRGPIEAARPVHDRSGCPRRTGPHAGGLARPGPDRAIVTGVGPQRHPHSGPFGAGTGAQPAHRGWLHRALQPLPAAGPPARVLGRRPALPAPHAAEHPTRRTMTVTLPGQVVAISQKAEGTP